MFLTCSSFWNHFGVDPGRLQGFVGLAPGHSGVTPLTRRAFLLFTAMLVRVMTRRAFLLCTAMLVRVVRGQGRASFAPPENGLSVGFSFRFSKLMIFQPFA